MNDTEYKNNINTVLSKIHPQLSLTNKATELLIILLKKDLKPNLSGELRKHADYEIKKAVKNHGEHLVFEFFLNEELDIQHSALIEYICVEILELAGNVASDKIKSQDIIQAIKNDVELNYLFEKVRCNNCDFCNADLLLNPENNFKLTQYVMENDFKVEDKLSEEMFVKYHNLCLRKKDFRPDIFGLNEANMICKLIIKKEFK